MLAAVPAGLTISPFGQLIFGLQLPGSVSGIYLPFPPPLFAPFPSGTIII